MNRLIIASAAVAAALNAAAGGPAAEDFKVRLTGVSVMSSEAEECAMKPVPPETRITVTPGNLAVFFLEYDFPTNVQSRLYLHPDFKAGVLDEDPFGTSGSGLYSGSGMVNRVVVLGAGGPEPYEKDLLLRSVRIDGEICADEGAPRNRSFPICSVPVNVLFANRPGDGDTGALELEPGAAPVRDATLGIVKRDPSAKPRNSTPAGFTDNLDEALARAKAGGRDVFVCFSGSDWCHWCRKLESEVLSRPEFVSAATNGFELVFIDSPHDRSVLSERAKAENAGLVARYRVDGFPTVLLLDGDGRKIAETGYRKGGPEAYAKHIAELRAKGPGAE